MIDRSVHRHLLLPGVLGVALGAFGGCDRSEPEAATATTAAAAATTMKEQEASGEASCPLCLEEDEQQEAAERHGDRVDIAAAAAQTAVAKPVEAALAGNGNRTAEDDGTPDAAAEPAPAGGPIQAAPDSNITMSLIGRKPNLDLEFTRQDGETINLAEAWEGKTIVLSSIYTSCPIATMCPRLTADFGWLSRQIPGRLREDIRLVLVSFDPMRDTPAGMKAYGDANGVDFRTTDMLVGDVEDVKDLLINQLEVPIDVDPFSNAITNHAMMIHVLNPEGYVVVERTATNDASIRQVAREMVLAATMPFDPEGPQFVTEPEPEPEPEAEAADADGDESSEDGGAEDEGGTGEG